MAWVCPLVSGRGAAQGKGRSPGSARTWGNAQPASSQKISQYSLGRARSPALLLFLSSIYVFFLLLVHSRAEQLWISGSFLLFFFYFFPPVAGLLPGVLRGQSFIDRVVFFKPAQLRAGCLQFSPRSWGKLKAGEEQQQGCCLCLSSSYSCQDGFMTLKGVGREGGGRKIAYGSQSFHHSPAKHT